MGNNNNGLLINSNLTSKYRKEQLEFNNGKVEINNEKKITNRYYFITNMKKKIKP